VYYARDGQTVILLLCGGDKRTQQADMVLLLLFTLYQKNLVAERRHEGSVMCESL